MNLRAHGSSSAGAAGAQGISVANFASAAAARLSAALLKREASSVATRPARLERELRFMVGGEAVRRAGGVTQQILDRVVVLAPGQPAQRHGAGGAGIGRPGIRGRIAGLAGHGGRAADHRVVAGVGLTRLDRLPRVFAAAASGAGPTLAADATHAAGRAEDERGDREQGWSTHAGPLVVRSIRPTYTYPPIAICSGPGHRAVFTIVFRRDGSAGQAPYLNNGNGLAGKQATHFGSGGVGSLRHSVANSVRSPSRRSSVPHRPRATLADVGLELRPAVRCRRKADDLVLGLQPSCVYDEVRLEGDAGVGGRHQEPNVPPLVFQVNRPDPGAGWSGQGRAGTRQRSSRGYDRCRWRRGAGR